MTWKHSGHDNTIKKNKNKKKPTQQNFKSAPLTSAPLQCWCCSQKPNVHRVASVYYKKTVLINHKTNRRTHTERPCPLMCIQQISFLRFQKLTIPAQDASILPPFSSSELSQSPCPPAAVSYQKQPLFKCCSILKLVNLTAPRAAYYLIHHPPTLLQRAVTAHSVAWS